MKLITLVGIIIVINAVFSIKLVSKPNDRIESKVRLIDIHYIIILYLTIC